MPARCSSVNFKNFVEDVCHRNIIIIYNIKVAQAANNIV